MPKHFLINSRSFTSCLVVLSFLLPLALSAQTPSKIADWLNSFRASSEFKPVNLLKLDEARSIVEGPVTNASYFTLNESAMDELLHQAPVTIRFSIPQQDGSHFVLALAKVEILAPEFAIGTKGDTPMEHFPFHKAVHYRGIIDGRPSSIASLSITSTGLSAMIADEAATWQIGMMENDPQQYIFYRTKDLGSQNPNSCFADEESILGDFGTGISVDDRSSGCKAVNIYFECDYKLYVDKGYSVMAVSNYITSLFNQVATLYANEDVAVAISQIYVWTSPDIYSSQNNIGAVLNEFRQNLGTTFNGNLAHFLTSRSLGGGIAYVDVICFKQYAFGVSCINSSFQNVPTYSWSVEVLTHELGHNLGSWHTQSCNWPNGALDNCVSPEGTCSPGPAPTNGGTIMSYCHLTANGINFNHGFGPVPGAKIRDKVLNSNCLTSSSAAPTNLSSSNITNTSATLSWSPAAGANNYTLQYKITSSSTWLTIATTNTTSFNLGNLSPNTAYNWQVKTDCSAYTTANFSTTGSNGNTCNPPANTISSNISSSTASLSWASVFGATSYSVQFKSATATAWEDAGNTLNTQIQLSGLSSSTTYHWRVMASCSAFSAVSGFVTNNAGNGNCNPPGTLTNNWVKSTTAGISWSPVPGAIGYALQIKRANSAVFYYLGTVPTTAVTISGLSAGASYHWRVRANCSYYSSNKILTTESFLNTEVVNAAFETGDPILFLVEPMEISPNPASDYLVLKHSPKENVKEIAVINDVSGKKVFEADLNTSETILDVSQLSPGVYALSIYQDNIRVTTEKVVIVR